MSTSRSKPKLVECPSQSGLRDPLIDVHRTIKRLEGRWLEYVWLVNEFWLDADQGQKAAPTTRSTSVRMPTPRSATEPLTLNLIGGTSALSSAFRDCLPSLGPMPRLDFESPIRRELDQRLAI